MLIILAVDDRPNSPADIDLIVTAELPGAAVQCCYIHTVQCCYIHTIMQDC